MFKEKCQCYSFCTVSGPLLLLILLISSSSSYSSFSDEESKNVIWIISFFWTNFLSFDTNVFKITNVQRVYKFKGYFVFKCAKKKSYMIVHNFPKVLKAKGFFIGTIKQLNCLFRKCPTSLQIQSYLNASVNLFALCTVSCATHFLQLILLLLLRWSAVFSLS